MKLLPLKFSKSVMAAGVFVVAIAVIAFLRAEDAPKKGLSKVQTHPLHILEDDEILATKGTHTFYRLPDIGGMSVVEFVQSGLFGELQQHGVRIIFEKDRSADPDDEPRGEFRIVDTTARFRAGDFVLIQVVGPTFHN